MKLAVGNRVAGVEMWGRWDFLRTEAGCRATKLWRNLAHFFATFALRYSCHRHNRPLGSSGDQQSQFGESKIFNAKDAKGARFRHGF
jgi:hypothetical protein